MQTTFDPAAGPTPTESAASGCVSRREKLAFAVGAVPDMIGFHAPKNLSGPIFNIGLGVNPALIGLVIALSRIWDAFTDPVMGAISDNTRSRFGRRKPYIVTGAVMCGLLFAAMWMVPAGLSHGGYAVFMTVMMLLFYTAFTIYTVPYHAIGYEITTDYHERTSVMSYRLFFNHVGLIIVGWLFAATQLPIFASTIEGMRWVGLVVGVIMIGLGVLPGLLLKEKAFMVVRSQQKVSLGVSIVKALKCRPFSMILAMAITQLAVSNLFVSLGFYLNVYYVFAGEVRAASIIQGWGATCGHIVAMASIPLWRFLSVRLGKRSVLKISCGLLAAGAFGSWFLFDPEHPYLQLVSAGVVSLSSIAFWLMIQSMIGDVCDEDEFRSHVRREGMFGAVLTWVQKVGVSLSVGVGGLLLVAIGFDEQLGGAQSGLTLVWMRFLLAGIPGCAAGLIFFLVVRYPLTEAEVRKVRVELDHRRLSAMS